MNTSRCGSISAVSRNANAAGTDRSATKGLEIVYYLRLPDGLIKIGTSSEPLDRLRRHRADKGQIEVLAIEFGGRDLERQRHLEFTSERHGNFEHFTPSDALMAHIATLREALNLSA